MREAVREQPGARYELGYELLHQGKASEGTAELGAIHS